MVPFGVVKTVGVELEGFEEKPTYSYQVNAGVYVIEPKTYSTSLSDQFTDMPTLLLDAKNADHLVSVFPIHEYWLDVGRLESLRQAHGEWPAQEQQ